MLAIRPYHWILLILVGLLACNEVDDTLERLYECHAQTTSDSTKTVNAVIGEWEWLYIQCLWAPANANGNEFKGLTIEFKTDSTLDVRENGILIQASTWQVEENGTNYLTIKADPYVSHIEIKTDHSKRMISSQPGYMKLHFHLNKWFGLGFFFITVDSLSDTSSGNSKDAYNTMIAYWDKRIAINSNLSLSDNLLRRRSGVHRVKS